MAAEKLTAEQLEYLIQSARIPSSWDSATESPTTCGKG